jgi:hypothetical protein
MTLSALVHLGWVVWSRERGTSGKNAQMGSCRYSAQSASSVRPPNIRHFDFLLFIFVIIVFIILQMVRAYSTQRRNRQRSMSCGSTRYTPSSYLQLQLLTARSTAQLHQHAIHFRSYTSQTHSIVTGSSFLRGGIAGAKLQSYETASIRKRGERHGSTTSRPSLVSMMEGAKQARANSTRLSCRTKDPRYALSIFLHSTEEPMLMLTTVANPTPTVQQSNTGTSLPREEL